MPVAAIGAFIGSVITEVGIGATVVGSAIGSAVGGVFGATALGDVIGGSIGAQLAGVALDVGAIAGLSAVSTLLNPVGHDGGTQVNFMANPQAGVPYMIGRTGTAGNIVMVDSAGKDSAFLTYVSVLSLGPIAAYESFQANTIQVNFDADNGEGAGTQNALTSITEPLAEGATVLPVGSTNGFSTGNTVTIDGRNYTLERVDQQPKELTISPGLQAACAIYDQVKGASATSGFKNRMWQKVQLGAPNSPYLTFTSTDSKDTPANHSGIPTVWTADCKLSGLAATMWTLEFDTVVYSGGTPGPMNVGRGVFVYDPRLDSTYAGGSGACRSNDETTWVYSENPYLHALTWCIGRTSNGVKTMGVHAPLTAIDIPAFVNGANIADANGWRIGGIVYSTDSKWDVLKSMLQAGSGIPLRLGAKISCFVNAPLVSLDTLTGADVVGKASIPTTTATRDRINALWPRYREEQQGWQVVPTQAAVVVADYVTVDGGQRTKEVEYTLVQDADQVATLARYDIENAREITPISLACKPRWMGYKPGDCITINEPEYGLVNQTCLILGRQVDPATLITTLTFRTETAAKHAFALGETANAPPTPGIQGVDPTQISAPGAGAWTAAGGTIVSGAQSVPVINVSGAVDSALAASVIFEFSPAGAGDWAQWSETPAATTTGTQITGLAPLKAYDVGVRYRAVKGAVSDRTVITAAGGTTTGVGSYGALVGSGAGDPGTLLTTAGSPLYAADVVTSEGTSANTENVGTQTATAVVAALTQAQSDIETAQAGIAGVPGEIAAATGPLQSDIDTINANLDPTGTGLGAELAEATTNITDLEAEKADASDLEAVAAQVNDPTTGNAALYARQTAYEDATTDALAETASASAVDELAAQLTSVPNLIANGDFSNGLANWHLGLGSWYAGTDPNIGSYVNLSPAAGSYGYIYSDAYPVGGSGAPLSLSYDGYTNGPNSYGFLRFYSDTEGNDAITPDGASASQSSTSANNSWLIRKTAPETVAPAGAQSFRVIYIVSEDDGTIGQISRVMVNYGPAAAYNAAKDLSNFSAGLTEVQSTAIDLQSGKADVSDLEELSAQVNDPTSGLPATLTQVTVAQEAIDVLNGKTDAYFTVGANTPSGAALLSVEADGSGSDVVIDADLIYLGEDVIFDRSTKTWRCDNGTVMTVTGAGFGTSNQFFEWFGPSMAIASCDESNAISYRKTNGDEHTTGTFTAGTYGNESSGTSTAASAPNYVVVGPFASRGGTIQIAYSYNYIWTIRLSGNQTASGSTTANVVVTDAIASGSTITITDQTLTATISRDYESESNWTLFTVTMSLSGTYTDTADTTASRLLNMALSRTDGITFSGGTIELQSVTQTGSIISQE